MTALFSQMAQFFAPFFVNPAFVLPGLLLIASPIIIHLLNRMRFRRVRFAAMEFLLQSQKRNRRRVLIEQLLLLLMRMAIVLLLMLLIARLVLNPDQLAILTGDKAHHLVLIDDSGSMQDLQTEGTAYDEAIAVVRKLVAEGTRRPNTQKLSLLFLSQLDDPVVREEDVNTQLLTKLETELENRRCTHQALNLNAGLERGGKLLAAQQASMKYLHVVSDFRQQDWEEQTAIAGTIRTLDESGVNVNLVRTVGNRHDNLGITELTGSVQVAAEGVPLRLRVGVRNFGIELAKDVRVSIFVDDQRLPTSITFEEIEAGKEVFGEKDLAFSAGKHSVRMELETDSLLADNARYLALDVARANPVLIIDGDLSGDEGLYIADALAADPDLTGYEPLVENVDFLSRQPLDRYQCIYMVNVAEVPPNALAPLTEYVANGGGLAWFLGPEVNAAFYNSILYNDGNGLFPIPLDTSPSPLSEDDVVTPGPDLKFGEGAIHPVFTVFAGEANSWIDKVRIEQFHPPAGNWERDDNRRADGVKTIASLRSNDPLFLEHRFGEAGGRIITCLTTAGPAWHNWPQLPPCFVPTHLELERYIAREDRNLKYREVGEPIALKLDPVNFVERVDITSPGGEPIVVQATRDESAEQDGDEPAEASDSNLLQVMFRETDRPGVYRVKTYDQNQQPSETWYAYNSPNEESDLSLMTSAALRSRIGEEVRVQIQEPGQVDWLEGKDVGQEVRDFLLYGLIVILILEQLLSYRLSYHPKTAGIPA